MKYLSILFSLAFSSVTVGDTVRPVWQFPILGSEHLTESCSLESNMLVLHVSFSDTGEVENLRFIIDSSVPAVNEEARRILEADSWSEFENMSPDQIAIHKEVTVLYLIPCAVEAESNE